MFATLDREARVTLREALEAYKAKVETDIQRNLATVHRFPSLAELARQDRAVLRGRLSHLKSMLENLQRD